MVIGSNKCPNGYSCVAGAADEFFACCPTKPSPSPPPPPTLPIRVIPSCKVGEPLPNIFCGRGLNRRDCPKDYSCNIDPTDRFAVCCQNGPPSSTQLPPLPSNSVCEWGTPLPNLNCGLRPCPRGYYCKNNPIEQLRACCRNPCSYGVPNTTLKCGIVVGSNKCTNGYSCVPGPADEPPVCCQTGKTKPGSCPKPKPGTAGICLQRCNGDFDCRGNKKCCSNGCGNECSDPEVIVGSCKVGQPLPNINCGRGPNRQNCPKRYSCNVHPTDKYAVCCRNGNRYVELFFTINILFMTETDIYIYL
ncbi:probable spore coat protein DDB_G0283555 [Mytilus californianus]|uniref:probable spore coat protein DDB_G0283555 n=1 Tax=Mytilus californianus TaxID=6549 RepID=UPI002246BE47|nr:probable spore coat protein DDB_G0283555 [Mytilus californianus]